MFSHAVLSSNFLEETLPLDYQLTRGVDWGK